MSEDDRIFVNRICENLFTNFILNMLYGVIRKKRKMDNVKGLIDFAILEYKRVNSIESFYAHMNGEEIIALNKDMADALKKYVSDNSHISVLRFLNNRILLSKICDVLALIILGLMAVISTIVPSLFSSGETIFIYPLSMFISVPCTSLLIMAADHIYGSIIKFTEGDKRLFAENFLEAMDKSLYSNTLIQNLSMRFHLDSLSFENLQYLHKNYLRTLNFGKEINQKEENYISLGHTALVAKGRSAEIEKKYKKQYIDETSQDFLVNKYADCITSNAERIEKLLEERCPEQNKIKAVSKLLSNAYHDKSSKEVVSSYVSRYLEQKDIDKLAIIQR